MLKIIQNASEVLTLDTLYKQAKDAGLCVEIVDDSWMSNPTITVKLRFKSKTGSWGYFCGVSSKDVIDAFIEAIGEARSMRWKI